MKEHRKREAKREEYKRGKVPSEDGGSNSYSLHVSDRGRTSPSTHVGGEGRLETGLPWLTLETLDKRCLFSTNISSGSCGYC